MNCSNRVTRILQQCLAEKLLQKEGGSYILGQAKLQTISIEKRKTYQKALSAARHAEEGKTNAREKGKQREALRVSKALKKACKPTIVKKDKKAFVLGQMCGF